MPGYAHSKHVFPERLLWLLAALVKGLHEHIGQLVHPTVSQPVWVLQVLSSGERFLDDDMVGTKALHMQLAEATQKLANRERQLAEANEKLGVQEELLQQLQKPLV